jgi:hypothetical protein
MKRLCGFLSTISLCAALIKNPTEALVVSLASLGAACLGFTAAEKIFKKD